MTRSQGPPVNNGGKQVVPGRNQGLAQSYHVELSSTLYGGDLRTPDTPSLMTQSMDPSILAQLAGNSSTTQQTPPSNNVQLMSR